jgi:hypothetical protein
VNNDTDRDAYQKVLASLRHKRLGAAQEQTRWAEEYARLTSLIEAIEPEADGSNASPMREFHGSRPYLGMTLPDAATAHLIAVNGSWQSRKALARAVRAGGHPTQAKDLEGNIGTALDRRRRPDSSRFNPLLQKNKKGAWRIIVSPAAQSH